MVALASALSYPPVTKEKLYECLAKTKGLRFMEQRFVPDSYMFQNLVFPAVGTYAGKDEPFTMKMATLGPQRCFPRGLDVMAVLGSERAYDILKAEGDTEYQAEDTSYGKQLGELREEFSAFNAEDWNRNLYWAWLYALKPLLEDFGQGYPNFVCQAKLHSSTNSDATSAKAIGLRLFLTFSNLSNYARFLYYRLVFA